MPNGRSPLGGADKFIGEQWEELTTGAPVLGNALAVFDCRLTSIHSVGTHDIILAEVVEVRSREQKDTLVYSRRQYSTASALPA